MIIIIKILFRNKIVEKLRKCIQEQGIHISQSRELVYKILKENPECMSAEQI